ncbi:MAG TPA: prolyl oligopeptidase family serine peptidase [Polyangiaceae bacterium]|nr:prolyl oligopeptidase family serine peptidase [Polyangiaceae bacterium]
MRKWHLGLVLATSIIACGESPTPVPSSPRTVSAPPPPAAPPALTTARPAYPPTPKHPEKYTVAGVSYEDDYAWLRDEENPAVDPWLDAQNELTNSVIGAYPNLDDLRKRFADITRQSKPTLESIQSTRAGVFGMRRAPSAPQPAVVRVASLDDAQEPRVLFDPSKFDATGQTAIDWYAASPDGSRIAVSLSKDGSEEGSLSVIDTATGKVVDGPISRVQYGTGGGSAAFSGDGKTVFYTRYPAPKERPEADIHFYQQLYRHTLGATVERDERVALPLPELPDIAEIELAPASRDGTLVVRVDVGDGGDHIWFVGRTAHKGTAWSRFAEPADGVAEVVASRDALYVLSRKGDLRGSVLRVPSRTPRLAKGKTLVPASDRELTHISVAGDALLAFDIVRGSSRARAFDTSGKLRGDLHLPARATVLPTATTETGAAWVSVETFTEPKAIQRVDTRTLDLHKTPYFLESPARFDDLEVTDEVATSRDGTKVPITVLALRGAPRSATTPLLLTGYGAHGMGSTPTFAARRRVWLDQGGVLAIAHVRGGNENGEAWHLAGKRENKQNVFDDFIAAAERLIAQGYTSAPKLAINGWSSGGLLMGAVVTQRPDLFRAAIIGVPLLDLVRFGTWPNGRFNATEVGSMSDPAVAPKLLAYSPYQNAKPAAYPSILIFSGLTDPRVNSADARIFAAKLQNLSTSDAPVLLRSWAFAGHVGMNVFKYSEQEAQMLAFIMRELDVPYQKRRISSSL